MNLYIGNLNYNVREGDLRGVMEEYGTVASVKLITDRETGSVVILGGLPFATSPLCIHLC